MKPSRTLQSRLMGFSATVLASAVVAAALAAKRSSGSSPPRETMARPIHVAIPVRREAMAHPIRATGRTSAKRSVDLGFLVGGEVVWVGVDVGARVKRGQVLARIDSTVVASQAERARAAAEKASRELRRASALERSGSVPDEALEDARTGEAVAASAVKEADYALVHRAVVAPDDGVIDARSIEPGEVVMAGRPAFRLSEDSQGRVVRVDLSDRDVMGLEVGRRASVRLDADPNALIHAHVSQVASECSPASGTFQVELRLDGRPPEAWKNGMTAKAEIERMVLPAAAVPIAAVVPGDTDQEFVVAIAGGRGHRVPVHVLFFEREEVALVESLDDVPAVATEGAASVADGSLVSVVQP